MAAGEVENFLGQGETSFYDSKKNWSCVDDLGYPCPLQLSGLFGYFEFPRNHGLGKSRDFSFLSLDWSVRRLR